MASPSSGRTPDDADEHSSEWRQLRPDVERAWGLLDVGKVAVAVVGGGALVSVPYALLVVRLTNELLAQVAVFGPSVTLGVVVFFTTTLFASFLFSAVMLVDELLPWESPLAL